MPSVMTANRLATGEVVYLAEGDQWVESLSGARAADHDGQRGELEVVARRDVTRNLVVGPYFFEVRIDGGALTPTSMRETIRARRRPTF